MSRVASAPVSIPSGVEVNLDGQQLSVKGPNGQLQFAVHELVRVEEADGQFRVYPRQQSKEGVALAGTTRALVNNMVRGVSQGFEKRLEIVGVGYRAQAQGQTLNLTLGFSHPVAYDVPQGVTVETPTQTEVVVKGADKQQVGQVAAEIRAFRPPEPYKGKGVKYADEHIVRKQAKKK